MAKVEFKNIYKSYDKKVNTIENLSLDINDKEFIVLVGPSGCGKSTLLRMIAGLEEVTGGQLLIDDKVVNNVHPKDRDIAMVFQNYALYPHMNVYENMAFGLKMRKFKKDEIDKRVKEAAKILDLEKYLLRKPKELSGGQRQRVALGRAIVRNPKVFLMDEPLSNLDAKLRVQMRAEIKKLHQKLKTTFVYVTHDQVEALTMGDRIVILYNGNIQQVDTPKMVYNYPENVFTAGFIGSPSMNFFDAKVIDENTVEIASQTIILNKPTTELVLRNKLVKKHVIVGVRPEYIDMKGINGAKLVIKPELIELLGSEKLVHFSLEGKKYSAKLPLESDVEEGKECFIYLDIAKMLLFDAVSEVRYK